MASDDESLVVSISADTRQILNAMKRLTGEIDKNAAGIAKQFESAGKKIDASMTTAMQDRINAMVGIGAKATKQWTGALAEQRQEMDRLRARFNPLFATITNYRTTISEIRAAHRLGAISSDEMTAALSRERTAALASISAIKQRNAALTDTPAARGVGGMNTANIAAQFQDIFVTTQMGMSPLQIALQQGTQLSAVLNQLGSGRQVIQGLGQAFLSVVNPISLVTIGTIAATTAAAQYFLTSEDGAEATAKSLQQQAELIQRVAQKWGEALPAIREYANEQERIAGKADIGKAFETKYRDTFKAVGEEVRSAGDAINDVMDLVRNTAPPDQVVAMQRAFALLNETAGKNKTTVADMEAAQRSLLDLFASTGFPVFRETAAAIEDLIPRLAETNAEMAFLAQQEAVGLLFEDLQASIGKVSSAKAREELKALMDRAKEGSVPIAELLAELAKISGYAPDVTGIIAAFKSVAEAANAARDAAAAPMWPGKSSQGGRTRYSGSGYMQLPETAPTPGRRPLIEMEALPRTGGGRSKEISEAERAKKAIDDVIASLRFEQEQLGRTGTEQRIYNELKRAGVDRTSEAGQKIVELVTKLELERQAIEATKRATEARTEAMSNMFQMGSDALMSMIDNSLSAEDALKRLIIQLALAALQAKLLGTGPLAGLFGSGGILRGIGGDPWAGLRLADGGTVRGPGGPTGDKIPAMLSDGEHVTRSAMAKKYAPLLAAINADRVPGFAAGGFVTPAMISMPQLRSSAPSGPSGVTFNMHVSVDGNSDKELMARMQKGVEVQMQQAFQTFDREVLPRRVNQIANDPHAVG